MRPATAHSAYCCVSLRCAYLYWYCIYQSCGHVSARVRPPSSRGNTPLSNAIYCPDPLHKMKYLTHSSRLWRVQASAARGQAAAVLKCGICLNFHAVTINRQHNHPRVPRLLTQTFTFTKLISISIPCYSGNSCVHLPSNVGIME